MRKFVCLLVLISAVSISYTQWEQRVGLKYFRANVNIGKTIYFGAPNGLVTYDLSSGKYTYQSSITSNLPGNYINDMLLMEDNTILVSTNKGLCLIDNGSITINKSICTDYPDNESRNFCKDSKGNIWTFSSHKVHQYKNGIWKSYDLSNNVFHTFDIMHIDEIGDQIWASYEDNTKTETTYYGNVINDYLHIAVIADSGLVRLFETKDQFPYRQGSMDLMAFGDDVLLKNYDGVYIYHDTTWSITDELLPSSNVKVYDYPKFLNDGKGNIWYILTNDQEKKYFPASINIKDKKITEYHLDDYQYLLKQLKDGTILVNGKNNLYIKNDTGWIKKSFLDDYGIDYDIYFSPYLFDGKIYLDIAYSTGTITDDTFFCLNDPKVSFKIKSNFPYTSITQFGINKKEQGMFKGVYSGENYKCETDSGFIKPNLISNITTIKPCQDGNVYFSGVKIADNSFAIPNLTTWEGNDLKTLDLGYKDSSGAEIIDFDVSGKYITAIGRYYYYEEDSLNSFLAVYNSTTGELKKYDKTNSGMPDFYYYKMGYLWFLMDTVPHWVSFDKNMDIWVATSYSLIKINDKESKIYETPKASEEYQISMRLFGYDTKSNELVTTTSYDGNGMLYYFDIETLKWDSLDLSNSGFHGKLKTFKKLLDNNVWASDDQGYLYNYAGKGKFNEYDLQINGKKNLGVLINDFSIDANNYLHLGTEVGLLTNKSILSDVTEHVSLFSIIYISPNPASDFIEINCRGEVTSPLQREIKIYDIFGQNVNLTPTLSMLGEGVRLDVSGLAPGMYFVRIGEKVSKFIKL